MRKLINVFFAFTSEMMQKLVSNQKKRKGWDNSNQDFYESDVIRRLEAKLEQIKKGERQEVDLANYAMFLNYQRNIAAIERRPFTNVK